MEFFNYVPDILGKLVELTTYNFWFDIINCLTHFWQTDAVLGKDYIKNTPIWLNPIFSVPINRQWFNHGVSTISDFLGTMNVILPMEEFMLKPNVKTNFLDYNYIAFKIKKYIEWKDLPLHIEDAPRNSSLNVLLNLSNNGVCRLYSRLKDSYSHVLDKAVAEWEEKLI